jgi:hypothetical protein
VLSFLAVTFLAFDVGARQASLSRAQFDTPAATQVEKVEVKELTREDAEAMLQHKVQQMPSNLFEAH